MRTSTSVIPALAAGISPRSAPKLCPEASSLRSPSQGSCPAGTEGVTSRTLRLPSPPRTLSGEHRRFPNFQFTNLLSSQGKAQIRPQISLPRIQTSRRARRAHLARPAPKFKSALRRGHRPQPTNEQQRQTRHQQQRCHISRRSLTCIHSSPMQPSPARRR